MENAKKIGVYLDSGVFVEVEEGDTRENVVDKAIPKIIEMLREGACDFVVEEFDGERGEV